MKLKLYSVITLFAVTIFIGCKTASKSYQKGNYDEAVGLAAKSCRKIPMIQSCLTSSKGSYRFAVEDHQNNIRNHSASSNELKWEWIYNDYLSLQSMHDAIHRSPSAFNVVHPVDYSADLITYADKAADIRFQRGLSLMQMNDRQSFRNAYHEFKVALNYKPADIEIQQKMSDAYKNAVVNVVILPVEQSGYQYSSYKPGTGSFEETIINSLKHNTGNEFVKFYSEWDAKSNNIRPDEIIDMRFSNMSVGRYYDNHNKRQLSKEVVIREIVYRPDSVVTEYGKVYAQITTTTRTMRSEAILQVNIRNGNGNWLWGDNFAATDSWNTEFASYTGDMRALSENDKQLINQPVQQPPRKKILFIV
jgi:hypothetical protein